jgi:hypothetical protein
MNRDLVWIERENFAGWGCSECAWTWAFDLSSSGPAGKSGNSLDELTYFEFQRDTSFTLHVCADHPGDRGTKEQKP